MKPKNSIYLFILIICLSCIHQLTAQTPAAPDTIVTDGRYLMGDRDSKADAREFALLDAKKKILEKAGSFIKSQDVVQNYQLTSQQIESYTLGTIKTEILEEKLLPNGSTFELVLTVQGIINPREVEELLQEMQDNTEMSSEIENLQQNYASLAAELDSLKTEKNRTETPKIKRESRLAELKQTELLMQFVSETTKKKPALSQMQTVVKQIPPNTMQHKIANGYLGIAYFKNEQYKPAIKHLHLALEHKRPRTKRRPPKIKQRQLSTKQQALFHYYLARSLKKTGRKKAAIRHLHSARQLNPQNKRYKTNLK